MTKKIFSLVMLFVFMQIFLAQKKKRDVNTEVTVKIVKEDGNELTGKMSGIYFPDKDSYAGMVAQSYTKYSICSDNVQFKFRMIKLGSRNQFLLMI